MISRQLRQAIEKYNIINTRGSDQEIQPQEDLIKLYWEVENDDKETHRGTGFSYDHFDNLIFKGQYSHTNGTQQLTWKENRRLTNTNLKETWETYAASITYVF